MYLLYCWLLWTLRLTAAEMCGQRGDVQMMANVGKASLIQQWKVFYHEFPYAVTADWSPGIHQYELCMLLQNGAHQKLRPLDLLRDTQLGRTVCAPRCQQAIDMHVMPRCAPRRASPRWTSTPPAERDMVLKINCSNLALPLSAADRARPTDLFLKFKVPAADEPLDQYWRQMTQLNTRSLVLATGAESLAALPDALSHFASIHYLTLLVHDTQPALVDALAANLRANFTELRGLRLRNQKLSGNALGQVSRDPSQLEYLDLASIRLDEFPAWLNQASNLLWLGLSAHHDFVFEQQVNFTRLSNVDNLPRLEFFRLTRTLVDELPTPLLASSTRLKLLDLSCNRLSTIQPDAFSHLTQLELLNLDGNYLATIDPLLLRPLTQLRSLSLRQASGTHFAFVKLWIHQFSEYEDVYVGPSCSPATSVSPEENFAGLQTLGKAHLEPLTQLEQLELANNPNLELEEGTLGPLAKLNRLDVSNAGLSQLSLLATDEGLCALSKLIVQGNDLSGSDWLSYEQALNMVQLGELRLDASNVTRMSGPLFLLAKRSGRVASYVGHAMRDTGKNPISGDACEGRLYDALLRNRPWNLADGECVARFDRLLAEIDAWWARRHDPTVVRCARTSAADTASVARRFFGFLFAVHCLFLLR